jgi:hypothetical protein
MNLIRLRAVVIVLLVVVAFSCNKDEATPPFDANNSVKPADFLIDRNYTSLTIEIAWVDGAKPTTNSLDNMVGFLNDRINKSGGITINQRTIPSPGKETVDTDYLRTLEKSNRTTVTSGTNLTLWIVFLDAEYSTSTDTEKVLGVAYGASSLAVFSKSTYALTPYGQNARITLETFVLSHEIGHILGLVNNGTFMLSPHQDTAHGAHCSDTECLMYWKAQSSLDLSGPLDANSVPRLDASCLADLKAAGGK